MAGLIFDPEQLRLGKHRGVVIDPRTLEFKKFAAKASALPPIPRTVTVTNKVTSWPMLGNAVKSDCTCASSGHRVIADSTRGNDVVTITEADALALYDLVNGGRDDGAYMLDVANALRKVGIGGHKIGAFVKIDVKNWDHVKLGMKLFGGIWLGVALPVSAQSQRKWQVVDGPSGAAGSWGGHAIWAGWATDATMTCVTWAQKVAMTKAFVQKYVDEAYFIIDPVWLGADAKSPQGFNMAALVSALSQIGAA